MLAGLANVNSMCPEKFPPGYQCFAERKYGLQPRCVRFGFDG